jgi:hypothetical protein
VPPPPRAAPHGTATDAADAPPLPLYLLLPPPSALDAGCRLLSLLLLQHIPSRAADKASTLHVPVQEASKLVVAAERAAATIAATVDFLLQHAASNSTQILLQAVLPRGFGGFQQPSM